MSLRPTAVDLLSSFIAFKAIPDPETPNYIAIFFSACSYKAFFIFSSAETFFLVTLFGLIFGAVKQASYPSAIV